MAASVGKLDRFSGYEESYKSQCVDPYRTTGKVYIPHNADDYRQTRYIPYYHNLFTAPDPAYAKYPATEDPALVQTGVEKEFLQTVPHSWMFDLYQYNQFLNDSDTQNPKAGHTLKRIQWMKNKRVLLLGDSVDRYMMIYLCNELGRKGSSAPLGNHKVAYCNIGFLNFTMYHWHIASMYTTTPSWWWNENVKQVPFEERYEEVFKQTLPDIIGMNGVSPDLVLYQSGFWDQVTFAKYFGSKGENELKSPNRQLTWRELRFYMSRMRQFITHIRSVFGDDVPLMYRTQSLHKTVDQRDLMVQELDRAARFTASEMSIEIFEWGKLVTGFSSRYVDEIHIQRGPLSWLWANMLLSYLFRASGGVDIRGTIEKWPSESSSSRIDAWGECHQQYIDNSIR